jgi:hypothetical protein
LPVAHGTTWQMKQGSRREFADRRATQKNCNREPPGRHHANKQWRKHHEIVKNLLIIMYDTTVPNLRSKCSQIGTELMWNTCVWVKILISWAKQNSTQIQNVSVPNQYRWNTHRARARSPSNLWFCCQIWVPEHGVAYRKQCQVWRDPKVLKFFTYSQENGSTSPKRANPKH